MSLHARLQAVRDDHALLVRSVVIRSAFAVGDWPPFFSSGVPPTARSSAPRSGRGQLGGTPDVREPSMGQPVG